MKKKTKPNICELYVNKFANRFFLPRLLFSNKNKLKKKKKQVSAEIKWIVQLKCGENSKKCM